MKILLDTNAYSAMMRGHDVVARRVREAEQIVLSAVVVGELLFGFRLGTRLSKNMEALDAFVANPHVVTAAVTRITADRFARIAATLRARGRPIPTNDIWVAAHAMETGAELLSFDSHFEAVDGLAWTALLPA